MRKNCRKKILAGVLTASMLLGLAGCGTETKQAEKNTAADKQETDTEVVIGENEEELSNLLDVSLNLDGVLDGEKDETVYVMTDPYGEKKSVIVSEWLKNSDKAAEIRDKSNLTDIENVKGDETFTQDGEDLVWKADGKPIYYQGKSDKEIPVDVKISYTLDGKSVQAEELKGAQGTVKIRFDYENKAKVGEVYAPFLCVTGLLLDGENFSEVQVSSGKVVADGNRFIVVGLAMPGMEDSLGLKEDSGISIPSYVEVTAVANKFSMDMSLTFATPFVLSEDALKLDTKELRSKIHEKADQFEDGVGQLADGIVAYTDGVTALAGGISQVDSGAKTLSQGASKLNDGAKSAKDGASKLAEGANKLNNAVKDMTLPSTDDANTEATAAQKKAAEQAIQKEVEKQGYTSKKVSDAMTKGVTDSLKAAPSFGKLAQSGMTPEKQEELIKQEAAAAGKASVTDDLKKSIAEDAAAQGQTAAAELQKDPSKVAQSAGYQQVYASVRASVEAAAYETAIKAALVQQGYPEEAYATLTEEQIAQYKAAPALKDKVEAAVNKQMSDMQPALVGAYVAGYGTGYGTGYGMGYGTGYGTGFGTGYGVEYGNLAKEFKAFTDSMSKNLGTNLTPVITAMCKAYAAAGVNYGVDQTLSVVKDKLAAFEPKIKELKAATKQLAEGSSQLNQGIGTLADGTGQLSRGASQLSSGTAQLRNGAGQLTANNSKLVSGANTLKSATGQVMNGLDKALDKGEEMIDKFEEIRKAGEAYKSYGGVCDGVTSNVKYIIKTDGISAD